jgi:hypothetical protein
MRLFEGAHGEEGLGGYHLLINSNTGEADLCADHSAKMDLQLQEATEGLNEGLIDMPDVEYAAASEESRVVAAEIGGGVIGQRYYKQQSEDVKSSGYISFYQQEVSTTIGYKQVGSKRAQASNRSNRRVNYNSKQKFGSSFTASQKSNGAGFSKSKPTKTIQPKGNVNYTPYTTTNGFDPVLKKAPATPKMPAGSSYFDKPGRQNPVFTERSRAVSSEKAQIRELGSKIAEITEAVSDRTSAGVLSGGVNTLGQAARVGKPTNANNGGNLNRANLVIATSGKDIKMRTVGLNGFGTTAVSSPAVSNVTSSRAQTAQSSLAMTMGGDGPLDAYNTRMAVLNELKK